MVVKFLVEFAVDDWITAYARSFGGQLVQSGRSVTRVSSADRNAIRDPWLDDPVRRQPVEMRRGLRLELRTCPN